VLATIVLQFIPLFLSLRPKVICETLWSSVAYIYYQPSYINLFVIYSFCRIDDLSWGTKGQISDDTRLTEYQNDATLQKFKFVTAWVLFNGLLSVVLIFLLNSDFALELQVFLVFMFVLVSLALVFVRSFCSILFNIHFYCFTRPSRDKKDRKL
jgi:chitin synthase